MHTKDPNNIHSKNNFKIKVKKRLLSYKVRQVAERESDLVVEITWPFKS